MSDQLDLLWKHVDKWAAEKPDAEALVFKDTRLTWGEFREQVDAAARMFIDLGVERGDRIGMVAMGCPEFMITFMAASKIGAIWLGLSPKFTPDELRYIISDAQPSLLITLRSYMGVDLVEQGKTFAQEFPCIEHVLVIGEGAEGAPEYHDEIVKPRHDAEALLAERVQEVTPDDEVLLMYTSGSTGKPKGVLQTHDAIIKNIEVEVEHFPFDEGARAL